MKKSLTALLAALLLLALLAACFGDAKTDTFTESETTTAAPEPGAQAELSSTVFSGEIAIAALNRVLAEHGVDELAYFHRDFTCEHFDDVTIYRTSGQMGYNTILAIFPDTMRTQVVDLDPYGGYSIQSIAQHYDDPDGLLISARSRVFGGDYVYEDFPVSIHYSLAEERVVDVIYHPSPGVYGMTGSADSQRFIDCTVEQEWAVLRFEVTPDSVGNGYAGPEIVVNIPYGFEDDLSAYFGFRNTEPNLSDDLIAQIGALPGVASVQVSYLETGLFTGTQLQVVPEDGYLVSCAFNKDGGVSMMEDFSIRCIPQED